MDVISRWEIPLGKNILLLPSSRQNDQMAMEKSFVHVINFIYIIFLKSINDLL